MRSSRDGVGLFRIIYFITLLILQCVQYVDNDVLNSLVPKLCEAIKGGIGLGTKVSAIL